MINTKEKEIELLRGMMEELKELDKKIEELEELLRPKPRRKYKPVITKKMRKRAIEKMMKEFPMPDDDIVIREL